MCRKVAKTTCCSSLIWVYTLIHLNLLVIIHQSLHLFPHTIVFLTFKQKHIYLSVMDFEDRELQSDCREIKMGFEATWQVLLFVMCDEKLTEEKLDLGFSYGCFSF